MKKLPLQNTETKGIPLGLQVNRAIARELQHPPESVGGGQKLSPDQDHNCCPLEVPTKFTLCKIKKAIQETKRKQPDLERMVESKLASPNTAKYIRKKKSSKVNFAESTNLYQDLVSLDISGTNLISNVEEDLQRRARHIQPQSRPPDPQPSLTDFFRQEEFLNVRKVGASDIFPLPSQTNAFVVDPNTLADYTDILLGTRAK